jgi:hypothetical protein
MRKKYLFYLCLFTFSLINSQSNATKGEYDLTLNEKKLNILLQAKFGRFNQILPYLNGGADISYAFSRKFLVRAEFALGKANSLELGTLFSYKNEIINQAHEIYHEPKEKSEYKTLEDEEVIAYINKHKMRSFRFGYYGQSVAASIFQVGELGYENSLLSKEGEVTSIKNSKGLPNFRLQNNGAYFGWSIYNAVNYTNVDHKTGITAAGRHNDYFCINLDLLGGVGSLGLTQKSINQGFAMKEVIYDHSDFPLGGRAIIEIGIKNLNQVLSFDTNLELAKYPYQKHFSVILGLGMRISLLGNVLSNEGE